MNPDIPEQSIVDNPYQYTEYKSDFAVWKWHRDDDAGRAADGSEVGVRGSALAVTRRSLAMQARAPQGCPRTTRRQAMAKLSDALSELSARVKKLEDAVAQSNEENRAKLEARRQEAEETFDRQSKEIENRVDQSQDKVQQWSSDTRAAVERRVEAMRADYREWRSEREVAQAQRHADEAEDHAVAAINVATYCVDAAGYAVIQAALARDEATTLAQAQ